MVNITQSAPVDAVTHHATWLAAGMAFTGEPREYA